MPNFSKGKYYNFHDDRGRYQPDPTIRKVSFKNNQQGKKKFNKRGVGYGGRGGGRIADYHIQEYLNFDSDDTPESTTTWVNKGHHNDRGDRGQREQAPLGQLADSLSGWYRVQVVRAARFEQSYVLNLLKEYVKPYEFEYFNFKKMDDETYSFFVGNFDLAEKLFLSRGRIKTVTNRPLTVIVKPNSPFIEVTDQLKEKIKIIMAKRFNAETNALDLSNFHCDPEFLSENLFVPLDRSNIMASVCKIISDNLPDLYALNLSDNKIYYRESLAFLAKSTPVLKIFYMTNNNIKEFSALRTLQGLPLEEVRLEGNPFKNHYPDDNAYTAEIRKLFPKVLKIDDITLPPPIVFDIEESISLPKPQGSFLCCNEAGPIARTFLEQYFALYDSDTRAGLSEAYHEQAQFSMVAMEGPGNNAMLSKIIGSSRNLLRLEEPHRQKSLLSMGKTEIMRALRLLPETKHDLGSLTCDCVLFSPRLIQMTICGLFKEISSSKKDIIRSFSRVFILVPNSFGGLSITNDQLYVTSATQEQELEAFKTDVKVQTPPPVVPSPQSPQSGISNEIIIKQNMVKALAKETGMNLQFSENCLNEVEWNYDRALSVFNEVKAKGGIPPEAFVQ